jgi:small neutral amino acid transporter SnatA (MarC family)
MARPPFDPQRAAFLLLAGVLAVHSVVVIGMTGACIWHADVIVSGGTEINCDPYNRLMGLMSAALAAALAFAGIRGPPPDKPPDDHSPR